MKMWVNMISRIWRRREGMETSNSNSIHSDLVIEILSRLPAKSIARFRCVSKLWESMVRSPYFTELFLTRSQANPRLLFAINGEYDDWSFYSSPPYNKSSPVVAADFHKRFLGGKTLPAFWIPVTVSGLIYFPTTVHVIYNPFTGKRIRKLAYVKGTSFLGFDPIDKQYKVLSWAGPKNTQILTLGTEISRWRKIKCPVDQYRWNEGICINGILYYSASSDVIVCFDVRSEKFYLIDKQPFGYQIPKLINYKGKLGGIELAYLQTHGERTLQLTMCVLEDVEKQEWSKYEYVLEDDIVLGYDLYVHGLTSEGEFVLSKRYASTPFYVHFFNPKRNAIRSVEIQGLGADLDDKDSRVYIYVDHEWSLATSLDSILV